MSEVPEMVERVARAIYEGRNGKGCKPWSLLTNAHKDPYRGDARASIEAMREPTEAMLAAASEADALNWSLEDGEGLDGVSWDLAYQAMIDAALSKK